MTKTPQKSFDLGSGGSTVLYFNGHPEYDAIRVDFNGGSTSTDTDVTFKVDSNDDPSDVEADGFANMDATVKSATVDTTSTQSVGTDAMARVVAVEIVEGTATAGETVSGTVELHNASDPAQNGSAFAQR